MNSILNSISALVILLTIILLLVSLWQKKKTPELSAFCRLLVWTTLWLISNYALKITGSHALTLISLKATFLFSIIMLYELYRFSTLFPGKIGQKSNALDISVIVSSVVIGALSITPLLVGDYTRSDTIVLAEYNSGIYLYFLFLIGIFTAILYNLYRQYQKASKQRREQAKLFMVGMILSMVAVSTIDLMIPLITDNNTSANFGPFGIIFFVFFTYIALMHHQLFKIKVLLSELWAILLIVIIAIWLVYHFTAGNLCGFLVVLSVCLLFIKSVVSEAEKELALEAANIQLEEDKEKLVELDKLKDDFISMASHELNTPISAIKGYLSMVLVEEIGGDIPEKARGYLDTVFQSAQRLSAMVSDLLNVSRIESGRIHLIYEQEPIEEVIKQAIKEVASKAIEAQHTLEFNQPQQKLPLTWFDISRVTEVLINFLGNAIKYTPNGGRITVQVGYDAHFITVSVQDNGKGIPKDKVDRVFSKFSQVDIVKDQMKGTGLGMYISKKFIELHKGKIWFESDGEGKGSTFYFSLPIITKKPFDHYEGEGGILQQN